MEGTALKWEELLAWLREGEPYAIAFSGGVDSTLLLRAAVEAGRGGPPLALIADTPTLPRRELREAVDVAEGMGVTPLPVKTGEWRLPAYLANPPDRCYLCKRHLFGTLFEEARRRGRPRLLDGNNADDSREDRPGEVAAAELGAESPLREVGLSKAEIRALSERLGLPTARKPALACLATRIPAGDPITLEKLAKIEAAEDLLHDLGFPGCRVRHHGDLARIELLPEFFPALISDGVRSALIPAFRKLGYRLVTLDLCGYGASPKI